MYTHLHVQSHYAFLRGLASPQALVDVAVSQGMDSLALTDHHSLTGAVEFYDASIERGIHPILGLEVNVALPVEFAPVDHGILVLLAMDRSGWRSLCRLGSQLNGGEDSLSLDQLSADSAGLICLTGGVRGALAMLLQSFQPQSAEWWLNGLREIFPHCLYVAMECHTPADQAILARLAVLANRIKLPIAAAHDVHYLYPEQANLQKVVSAIRCIQPLASLKPEDVAPANAGFLSQKEMVKRFAHYPGALTGNAEIVSRCQLTLPLGEPRFPEVDLPAGMSALDRLRQKAEEGAIRLYPARNMDRDQIQPEVRTRLDHELDVIGTCGYAALFLIVEEILNYARQHGVPFSSRGSAASSLVAHCLGITSPDPIQLNLYFERFLNPVRATPPDIDTDLCSKRRESVIRFVYRRFGEDRVATVCTINRFRSRSALREVAKAYGLPPDEVKILADSLPYRWYGPPQRLKQEDAPYSELEERFNSTLHKAVFRDAEALIELPHHLSVHPGGMVIAPGSMTDLVPTQMASKGVTITQFDLNTIERMGLVKIDLLGIRGLTVLGDVANTKELALLLSPMSSPAMVHGVGQPPPLDVLELIPEEDPLTSDTLEQGRTIGCFQIESPGMRATLRQIHARSQEDIMVALALYRPGPLTGGLKDAFVRRHLGLEPVTHLHPALSRLLEGTYGVILYQEQVLRIAHELAGLSLTDSDLLRRAMSHFDPGKQMQTLKEKFIAGAYERNNVPQDVAERVWDLMAAFAGYGFPKAHAASYAQIGWRSAWCKTHLPGVFMAGVLANWGGYYRQGIYLNEARRLGLAIHPPHINHAQREFSLEYQIGADDVAQPVLYMGLDQVRDLTRRTQSVILRERPFSTLHDFLARVDPRPVEAENLVRSGSLEGLGTIPSLLREIKQGGWRGGQLSLFGTDFAGEEDWSLEEKVAGQEDILGTGVIAHPLELASDRIREANALTTLVAAEKVGEYVRVAGMRQTWRRRQTSRGDYIYFMALEDLEGALDVVIFSDVYRRSRSVLKDSGPYLLEGMVELDGEMGEPFIRVERVEHL